MLIPTKIRPIRYCLLPVLALTAGGLQGTRALAANIYWDQPAGGTFEDANSWSSSGSEHISTDVPDVNDNALFTLDSTYDISFTSDESTGGLLVRSGDVAFDLGGHTYTVAVFQAIGDSNGASGILTLRNGTLAAGSGAIALGLGSSGTVTVTGSSAQWTHSGDLYAGNGGNGILRVEAGARVTDVNGTVAAGSASTSTVTVMDAGSIWANSGALTVGDSGDGTLSVEGDGQVTSATGVIGANAGSSGTVTVTGANSRWDISGSLTVGDAGNGTLNILDEANVTSNGGDRGTVIGGQVGSVGVVILQEGTHPITATTWTNQGNLKVGDSGQGTLTIAGRVLNQGNAYIGYNVGAEGIVTVKSGGELDAANLFLSRDDYRGTPQGTLTIEQFGTVWVNNYFQLYDGGTIHLSGGTLRLNTIFRKNNDGGVIDYAAGTIQLGGVRDLGADSTFSTFFPARTVTAGKRLIVEGDATLSDILSVQTGGGFQVGFTDDPANLFVKSALDIAGFNAVAMINGTAVVGDSAVSGILNVSSQGEFVAHDTLVVGSRGAVNISDGGRVGGGSQTTVDGVIHVGTGGILVTYTLNLDPGALLAIDPGGRVQSDYRDYQQSHDATLRFTISGTERGVGLGFLNIRNGDIHLDGALEIRLAGGFTPGLGDEFDLFDVYQFAGVGNGIGEIAGAFASLDLAELPSGLQWDTSNLYLTGVLGVVPEPTALGLLAFAAVGLLFKRP